MKKVKKGKKTKKISKIEKVNGLSVREEQTFKELSKIHPEAAKKWKKAKLEEDPELRNMPFISAWD